LNEYDHVYKILQRKRHIVVYKKSFKFVVVIVLAVNNDFSSISER